MYCSQIPRRNNDLRIAICRLRLPPTFRLIGGNNRAIAVRIIETQSFGLVVHVDSLRELNEWKN